MSMKTILVPMEAVSHATVAGNRAAIGSTVRQLHRRIRAALGDQSGRWRRYDGRFPLETYTEDIEEEAKQARQIFESFMQRHDVPRSTKTIGLCHSAGWTMRQRVRVSLAAMAAFST